MPLNKAALGSLILLGGLALASASRKARAANARPVAAPPPARPPAEPTPQRPPSVVPNGRITSPFGPRRGRMHQGIDIAAPRGSPVYAAGKGRVVGVYPDGQRSGYGNSVLIKHSDGTAAFYAHLDRWREGLQPGDELDQGELVGFVGTTEAPRTGMRPHLHLEIHQRVVTTAKGYPIINPQTPARIDPVAWLARVGAVPSRLHSF